jgi:hypothetical protein
VVDSFPLTPGESTTFLLRGLPLGRDQFSASAYPTSCEAVTTNSVANWVSDPVAATLAAGIVVDVALIMHRNGRANVSIDFQDDPAGMIAGDGGQASDATADTNAAICSPQAVAATTAQAATAVHNLLATMGPFCFPAQTSDVGGSSLSLCSTAACTGIPNTCAVTLGAPTFAFNSLTQTFTATADITVSGGAAGAGAGFPVSCNDLVLTAPGTVFSGHLTAAIQTIPDVPSGNILYTVDNVIVHTNSLGASGCGIVGPTLDTVIAFSRGFIEQNAANVIRGRMFSFPCPVPG